MEAWVIWVVVAVVLLIAEATTSAFVAIYFGLAAIAAAAIAAAGLAPRAADRVRRALGGGPHAHPARAQARRRAGPAIRTGVDAMQGRVGVVTRAIAELEPGQVKIGGEMWTARCFYDEEPIAAGSRVEVVKVEGVTALVIPAPSARDDPTPEPEEPHA